MGRGVEVGREEEEDIIGPGEGRGRGGQSDMQGGGHSGRWPSHLSSGHVDAL